MNPLKYRKNYRPDWDNIEITLGQGIACDIAILYNGIPVLELDHDGSWFPSLITLEQEAALKKVGVKCQTIDVWNEYPDSGYPYKWRQVINQHDAMIYEDAIRSMKGEAK